LIILLALEQQMRSG